MKKILLGIYFLTAIGTFSNIFGQTPAQIDVTAISIYRSSTAADASFTLTATNLPAPYQSILNGIGEVLISPMDRCFPCFLGDKFRTDYLTGVNPPRFINGFKISGSDNKQVKFTVTGTSPDVVLSPRILLRNKRTVVTVPTRMVGKIELFDQNTLIAVDENVDLTGTLKAEFSQYRSPASKRVFDFKSFTFSYSQ